MNRVLSTLKCCAALAVLLIPLVSSAQEPARYHSDDYDYSIDFPEGWEQVPEREVEEDFPAARDENSPSVYDAVFARKTDGPRYGSAYMILRVTPYSALVRDKQPYLREQDIRQLLERKSSRNRLEVSTGDRSVERSVEIAAREQDVSHYDPHSHTYATAADIPVRDIGKMRGQIYGWFGDDVLVELTLHVHSKLWDKYRPLYIDTVESFEFDDGAEYEPGFWNELPPLVRQAGLALLLTLVIVGGITLWKRRRE